MGRGWLLPEPMEGMYERSPAKAWGKWEKLDAGTIAMRILQAGRTITEKFSAKTLCFSAGSRSCAAGIVRNPINPAHNTSLGLNAPPARIKVVEWKKHKSRGKRKQ